MAQRRMFSLAVTDTDAFQDMPTSSQALYFHLGMHGDDDGFVGSPRKIMRAAGCNSDDLRLLATKGFIIPFESGVIVIRDWKVNNSLKNDRYHETLYQAEKALLDTNRAGAYEVRNATDPQCFQAGSKVESEQTKKPTKRNEQNKDGEDKPPRAPRFTPPSVEDVAEYCRVRGNQVDPQRFVDFYAAKGWMVGKNKMKDWKAAVRTWERRDTKDGRDITNPDRYGYKEGESL